MKCPNHYFGYATLLALFGFTGGDFSREYFEKYGRVDKYMNPEDLHLPPCFNFIMEAYNASNFTKVKRICEEFHHLAGNRWSEVENVHLDKKWLAFQAQEDYPPMQIDVLTYEVELTKRTQNQTVFYITSGVREDCVYYLVPTPFNSTLFHLTEDVCNVSKSVFFS